MTHIGIYFKIFETTKYFDMSKNHFDFVRNQSIFYFELFQLWPYLQSLKK